MLVKIISNRRKVVNGILAGFWLVLSLISINHIFGIFDFHFLSVSVLGIIAWAVIILTLILLSSGYLRPALSIFVVFCCFGAWFGPFLEPPSDPLLHLKRTHEFCGKRASQLPVKNRGFWHYSMSTLLVCGDMNEQSIETTLLKLNILHGIFLGTIMVGLFILGKSAGVPSRWAFLSCCISFLFFGTNRFSYFSYYSFGTTFSSMLIYWLWVAVFFFRKSCQAIITGILAAFMLLPILWVNHIQEASFLVFVVVIWILLNTHEKIWQHLAALRCIQRVEAKKRYIFFWKKIYEKCCGFKQLRLLYLLTIVFVFFILPQVRFFQNLLEGIFVRNLWEMNQAVLYYWLDFHLMGKVWDYRISDTFSWIGLVIILLTVPFFYPGLIRKNSSIKARIFLLSILPFVGYCIPLINYVWLSNVAQGEYYRLCYSSMFWLFFAYLLWGLESRFILAVKKIRNCLSI